MAWYPGNGGLYARRALAALDAGRPEEALADSEVMIAKRPFIGKLRKERLDRCPSRDLADARVGP